MPENGRILKFPAVRSPRGLSAEEARPWAQSYLDSARSERDNELKARYLSDPEVTAAICRILKTRVNSAPSLVAEEAIDLHESIKCQNFRGLFDEREYFLGETAFLAAGALRVLGKREDTERWLDRAESRFRHVVNPAPHFAAVSYLRVALSYDKGRYEDVVELTPSLISSFDRLGMLREEAKARLLRSAALKVTGRTQEALDDLGLLLENPEVQQDGELRARVLIDVGDIHQIEGRIPDAIAAFQQASSLLQQSEPTSALGDLRLDMGALLRSQNRLNDAVAAYRGAQLAYASLQMATRVAYAHVLTADVLLALGRPREAEWELLAALPTIEEQKMVPEGFAAMELLKGSVRQRKTDPNALRELREHLQASNQK